MVAPVGVDDPIVVLGVLVEILGSYAVAGRGGIARHGDLSSTCRYCRG